MNKKFSTLLATLLVAGGMSSASAAMNGTVLQPGMEKITKIETDKVYQLYGGSGQLLVMEKAADGTYKASFKTWNTIDSKDLSSTLWTIVYKDNMVGGPDFTFVNKATGCPLSVDLKALTTTAANVNMGGNVSSWKWFPATTEENGFDEAYGNKYTPISYFKTDSVVYLSVDPVTQQLKAQKEHVSKVSTYLHFAPYRVPGHALSAKELNSKLATDPEGKSFKLSAIPELKIGTNSSLGNIFTKNTLRAWNLSTNDQNNEAQSIIYNNFTWANSATDYVLLQVIDNDENQDDPFKDTYVMADTAYIDGLSVNNQDFVKFTDTVHVKTGVSGNGTYIDNFYPGRNPKSAMFKFTYFPTEDSIAIDVLEYNKKASTASSVNGKSTIWATAVTDANTVIVNKLTTANELTLGNAPANIKFILGEGTTNRTSKDNGVYVIKNKKGQYLAVPIYNTKLSGWSAAEWVTVDADAQDVMRMPAYQWVAVKNDSMTVDTKKISSMTITNREFAGTAQSIQLRQNPGAEYLFTQEIVVPGDSLIIEAVPASVIANKELGYLNLEDAELAVMTYNFNYLHSYADDKFIGMMEDSVLNVKDGKYAFFMKESKEANYGFTSPYVAGLKQLTRVIYTPYVKTANGDRYITIDAEKRYRMTYDEAEAQKFYLKENNFYKPASKEAAQPYYAFINVTETADSTKMGSADQDLNVILRDQVLNETRTSAFAVVPNDAPLYRRFNTELEGAVEGQEDATKILKFKEFYRGEYLMDENNKKFQDEVVNYVGIERADKATGLSFYVDTVVVKGTAGHEQKPQYFVYVDRVVVDPVPGKECQEGDNHVDANGDPTDAAHCVHATPSKAGFTVAKYMVSFADSLSAKDADKLYKFGEYTRVGFVKGLHIGDSLYILTNGFENMEASKLDTAAIRANYKATSNEFNIIDLKAEHTDAHHNYTWSFRYTNPEAAAAVDEDARRFLIESDKKDADNDIAPSKAAWLKSQNGCLVLSDAATSTFENAKTGGDNALIFNIEVGSENDLATDNEEIATSEVTVIAGAGQVTIANAAGKKVVVSNILGQTVANTVITSDNAVIAAPQGVVVVAVEGEEAVKAIVK